jgi:hypothetical protein
MNGNHQHLLQFVEQYFTHGQSAEIAAVRAPIPYKHSETEFSLQSRTGHRRSGTVGCLRYGCVTPHVTFVLVEYSSHTSTVLNLARGQYDVTTLTLSKP